MFYSALAKQANLNALVPQAIPGNGFCESGELPASPGGDCQASLLCPTPNRIGHAAPCGHVGACDRSIGACVCAPGYIGLDCGTCDDVSGYVSAVVQQSGATDGAAAPAPSSSDLSSKNAVDPQGTDSSALPTLTSNLSLEHVTRQQSRQVNSGVSELVMCSLVLTDSSASSTQAAPSSASDWVMHPPPSEVSGSEESDTIDADNTVSWENLKWYIAAGIGGAVTVGAFVGLMWTLNSLRRASLQSGGYTRPGRAGQQGGYRASRVVPLGGPLEQSSAHGEIAGNAVVEHLLSVSAAGSVESMGIGRP